MQIALDQAEHACCLTLAGEMTVGHAASIKDAMLSALDAGNRLLLDLSAVTRIDTAGVQLLMLVWHHAKAVRKDSVLAAVSPAVASLINLYNLQGLLGRVAPSASADADATALERLP